MHNSGPFHKKADTPTGDEEDVLNLSRLCPPGKIIVLDMASTGSEDTQG